MTATLRGISVDGREGVINQSETEYTVVYRVTTDDKNDGPGIVLSTPGLPSIGDLYSVGNDFDPNAVVVSKTPRQLESPNEWEVEVTASTEVDSNPSEAVENPLNRPSELSFGFNSRRVLVPGYYSSPSSPPTDKSFNAAVLAPNGEPFVPQPEMDIAEPVLTVSLNRATLPPIMDIQNTVNADFFFGATPRQLRLTASAQTQWHRMVGNYWRMTYTFVFRYETWDVQILNQGTYYWLNGLPADPSANSTERLPYKDKEGRPLVVNLTTKGKINTTNTPTYSRYRVYREINFTSLGIL